ncbi:MAG: hypothetical protein ACOCXD_00565 [Bacteroidota bacterium]
MLFLTFFSILALISISNSLYAQETDLLFPYPGSAYSEAGDLYLDINTSGFFRNNEYFNEIVDGYTLAGTFMTPAVSYHPTGETRIDAGVHMLYHPGMKGFKKIMPVFSFRYQFSKSGELIIGKLEGAEKHGLLPQLLNPERTYLQGYENGLQVRFNAGYFHSDVWLNWENYIFTGDTTQEVFTQGTSTGVKLLENKNTRLVIPVQTMAVHRGGQINETNKNISTLFNLATGVDIDFLTGGESIESIGVDFLFFGYVDLSPAKLQAFENGTGMYVGLGTTGERLELDLGYWYGNRFIAPGGEEIYQSVSYKNAGLVDPYRGLGVIKASYGIPVGEGLQFGLFTGGFYDLSGKLFDYYYGLHLFFSRRFFLLNYK